MSDKPIYIIDDDTAVRDSLSFLLETHGFAPQLFETGDAFLQADLSRIDGPILLDVRMPGRDGLEVLKLAKAANPALKIVMMSGHADIAMAVRALKNGAADFVEKPFQAKDVVEILERISAANETPEASQLSGDQIAARATLSKLTPREAEIAAHLVTGSPNKIVAHALGISVRTVETHRARIMSKLDIMSLSELVRLSLRAE